ncbi:hypothetical protein VCB84_003131 [Providencia rettgeri]|nr:hypothetical protein [Providencia rettgeri]EJD6644120.1 hypothetical protein [Providencia rettgeri]ELL9155068.1 hypothetical protein [Providencia rettgeri]ELR5049741.1 hypothetical protein [Providencia rettgeri]ELR5062759.1 hypothetical protein [Providencia rettgeri]
MNLKLAASVAIISALLAGCDNSQTASESNFKKSIQDYLDTRKVICINVGQIPAGFITKFSARNIEQLDTLVDAGLLAKAEKQVTMKDMWSGEHTGEGVEYTLTSEGEKFYDEKQSQFSGRGSFCTGKLVVNEVTNFTEPAERGGQKISIANYTQKLEDVAPWAKNEKVMAAYPQIQSAQTHAERAQQSPLILTNNGWVHMSLFNKK